MVDRSQFTNLFKGTDITLKCQFFKFCFLFQESCVFTLAKSLFQDSKLIVMCEYTCYYLYGPFNNFLHSKGLFYRFILYISIFTYNQQKLVNLIY